MVVIAGCCGLQVGQLVSQAKQKVPEILADLEAAINRHVQLRNAAKIQRRDAAVQTRTGRTITLLPSSRVSGERTSLDHEVKCGLRGPGPCEALVPRGCGTRRAVVPEVLGV